MSVQRFIFFVLSALFFLATVMWFKDEFSPKWMEHQKKFYEEQVEKVERDVAAATSAKEKRSAGKASGIVKEACV